MRRPTLLFVAITAGVGLCLFQLKYQVMNLEKDHNRIRKTIRETNESIHVLKAEWAYLNDPRRLQDLCERHLTISPIKGSQLVSLQEVTGADSAGMPGYDRGAMDQLVEALVSDATLVALND